MFVPNCEVQFSLPISFTLATPLLGTGEVTVDITSAIEMPLKDGQKFILSLGPTSATLTVNGDQSVIAGANTLSIAPNLLALPIGANTNEAVDRRGNSLEQTIQLLVTGSVSLQKKETFRNRMQSAGAEKEVFDVRGRMQEPFRASWLYDLTNSTMRVWRGPDSYTQGVFKPFASANSRVGLDDFFGEKLRGEYFLDTPNRIHRGQISGGNCC